VATPNYYWKSVPPLPRTVFLLGVFFIFGTIGSAIDVAGMGLQSTGRYLVSVILFGLFAIVYATSGILLRAQSVKVIFIVVPLQMVVLGMVLRFTPTPQQMGAAEISQLHRRLILDAAMTIAGMVLAYSCFIFVFISEGRRYFRVHAEMELAREIHRVLVPKLETKIGDFEFYGCSLPSGVVGGDLIDLVQNGDKWIAYIADVSGHGVAPGSLPDAIRSLQHSRTVSNLTHYPTIDGGRLRFGEWDRQWFRLTMNGGRCRRWCGILRRLGGFFGIRRGWNSLLRRIALIAQLLRYKIIDFVVR